MMPMCPCRRRSGFTILEVVIIVVMLGIAVPPTLGILMSSASSRADTINTSRATTLAGAVLEAVVADTHSSDPALGFDALADPDAYLETPTTGLYDRLRPFTDDYDAVGLTYEVEIGPLVASDGAVSADSGDNVFRVITVRVRYPASSGASYEMPVSVMVTDA